MAHNGVLFLDELAEVKRSALEALREPLENGHITISRAATQAKFPARFQLIAAMNPCPCGYLGSSIKTCRCTPDQVSRYQGKLSGPLLDRIDLQVEVTPVAIGEISQVRPSEPSAAIRERVPSDQRIELGMADGRRLAANAVCLGDAVVMSAASEQLRATLGEVERALGDLGLIRLISGVAVQRLIVKQVHWAQAGNALPRVQTGPVRWSVQIDHKT